MHKIVALKETAPYETRVAITPETAKKFIMKGFSVYLEKGAGLLSSFSDEEYEKVGVVVSSIPLELVADADLLLKVMPSSHNIEDELSEFNLLQEEAIVIGMLNPYDVNNLTGYTKRKLTAFSLELLPRITRAQSMDVLSSQANLAGYQAVIEAFYHLGKVAPMMTTAAGAISAAKVLVLGAGVAGLQAIATAKRLGAVVYGYDVRAEVREQVESVGGKFLSLAGVEGSGVGGYARALNLEEERKLKEMLLDAIAKVDVVITTALIPGRKAPILIDEVGLRSLRRGAVVVDLAASQGGNVTATRVNEIVEHNGVKVIGYGNLARHVAADASKLYAKNVYNFVELLYDQNGKQFRLDVDDEIVKKTMVTRAGEIL